MVVSILTLRLLPRRLRIKVLLLLLVTLRT
jgi:hypothetical protein